MGLIHGRKCRLNHPVHTVEGATEHPQGDQELPEPRDQPVAETDESEVEVMNPEQARKLLDAASKETDMGKQAHVFRTVIKELCEAGFHKEAWDMIISTPGFSRDSQIFAFFYYAEIDLAQFAIKYDTLNDTSEKKNALGSYLGRNLEKYPAIMDELKPYTQLVLSDDPGALSDIMGKALRIRYDTSGDEALHQKIVDHTLELHQEGVLSDTELSYMMTRNLRNREPRELWSWVSDSTFGIDEPESYPGQLRAGIVQRMVMSDPVETLSQMINNPAEPAAYDLAVALSTWTSKDPTAANGWYIQNKDQLSQIQLDVSAYAFAESALELREFDGSESWANQIENEDMRNEALENISRKKQN